MTALKSGYRVSYGLILFASMLVMSWRSAAVEHIYMPIEVPTNFVEQGQVTGTTTAIILELKKRLRIDTPIEALPFARAYNDTLSTPNSILFTVAKTPARIHDGLIFIGPVATHSHAVFSRPDVPRRSRQEILRYRRPIVGLRGDMRSELLKSQGFNVIEVTEHDHGLQMLNLGRVDYWISSDMETAALNIDVFSDNPELLVTWLIKKDPSYFAFAPNSDPALIEQWQNAFSSLADGEFYTQQVSYWQNKLDLPIQHSVEQGFFLTLPLNQAPVSDRKNW